MFYYKLWRTFFICISEKNISLLYLFNTQTDDQDANTSKTMGQIDPVMVSSWTGSIGGQTEQSGNGTKRQNSVTSLGTSISMSPAPTESGMLSKPAYKRNTSQTHIPLSKQESVQSANSQGSSGPCKCCLVDSVNKLLGLCCLVDFINKLLGLCCLMDFINSCWVCFVWKILLPSDWACVVGGLYKQVVGLVLFGGLLSTSS